MVAGKWRQLTFTEVPHGPDTRILREHANYKVKGVLEILACAGWTGDNQEIQRQVSTLIMKVERIRINVKAAILYADYQPWIATYGDDYDSATMIVANGSFGAERVPVEGCHVLGSVGLGWKNGGVVKRKPLVLLIESFGDRLRRTTKQTQGSTTT